MTFCKGIGYFIEPMAFRAPPACATLSHCGEGILTAMPKKLRLVAGMQGHRVEFPHSLRNLDACSRYSSRPVRSRSLMHELYPNAKCADPVSMRFIEHSVVSFKCSSCIFETRMFLARAVEFIPPKATCAAGRRQAYRNGLAITLQDLQKRQCSWHGMSHRIFVQVSQVSMIFHAQATASNAIDALKEFDLSHVSHRGLRSGHGVLCGGLLLKEVWG